MKIFVSHSTNFDFQNELYTPLKNSDLAKIHEFVFPHDAGAEINIKDVIRDCDMVVAEVTQTSFEQGLELGWANGAYVTTVCFYKPGTQISSSLNSVSEYLFEYDSIETMGGKITQVADTL